MNNSIKLKFGTQELNILRVFDAASSNDGAKNRNVQFTLTVDSDQTVDELSALMAENYTGDFIIDVDGDEVEYTGFPEYDINKNIEVGTEIQTLIRLSK